MNKLIRIAKDLFLRMCQPNVDFRYSASTALTHPWITREFGKPIPLTNFEEDNRQRLKNDFKIIARSILFSIISSNSVFLLCKFEKATIIKPNKRINNL